MNLRSYTAFFPTNKSLWEIVVDTFNFVYERSPVTMAFATGYHHPRIPRLTGHAILGRAPEIAKNADGLANQIELMAKLAVDENNPRGMAYCSLTIVPSILITRPTDIAQVLQYNDDKVYRNIPALNEVFGHENLFALRDGPAWREKRNKLRRWILSQEALTELAPEMQKIIDDFSEQLRVNGKIDSLEEFLVSLTMNVFAQTRMGSGPLEHSIYPIADGLGKAIDAASDPMNNVLAKLLSTVEYLRAKLPVKFQSRLDVEKTKLKDLLDANFFLPQKEKLKKTDGLLKDYFDRNKGNEEKAFAEAYSDTALYLLAGQETTERLLQFTLILLKKHPQVLAELRSEIQKNRPLNNKWTKESLDNMHYLGKILKEVLRLYPPIPLIPRIVSTPLILGDIPLCNNKHEYDQAMANRDRARDVILSRGTSINISPWVTQRMASLYDKPLEFIPERHASDSISINADGNKRSYAFIPFGAGNRDCPGRMFAIQEAKIALISFVDNFDFTTSLDDKVLETYIRGTLKMKEEIHAVFTPRQ
jgi:cytochrome P450